jgi:hypothetical protein
LKLFNVGNSKKEKLQFKSRFREYDGYNILLFLLNIYENTELKTLIAIILREFYCYDAIPEERKIIIDVLVDYLKDYVGRLNKSIEDKNIFIVIRGLIGVWLNNKNRKSLVDMGVVSLLLPVIEASDIKVLKNVICLLSNVCYVESVEDKNSIINHNVFNVFYEKLSELSPPPCLVIEIVRGVDKLLVSNPSGVKFFLETPLIRAMFEIFNSSNIIDIISYISNCFSKCCDTYENDCCLVENKVVDSMINIIEMYMFLR